MNEFNDDIEFIIASRFMRVLPHAVLNLTTEKDCKFGVNFLFEKVFSQVTRLASLQYTKTSSGIFSSQLSSPSYCSKRF